jgi:hypothetical protein
MKAARYGPPGTERDTPQTKGDLLVTAQRQKVSVLAQRQHAALCIDAQLAAVVAVLLDGVFVVNAGDQALVGDEQQGQAGGFINTAALGFQKKFSRKL